MTVRDKIYRSYGKDFQDTTLEFDLPGAMRFAKAYQYYLKGWLPAQRDVLIVDLGCGSGRLLYFLKSIGFKNLKGVDISADQVAVAKQVISDVEKADALDWLENRSNEFDLIIALDLIEHFYKEEALIILERCYNALKSGGRLILQTPNADTPFGLYHRYNDITHEWAYNVNQLTRLLRRSGFVGIQARETGPVPCGYSLVSTIRYFFWKLIRLSLIVWNLIETGQVGSNILTRVFLISAQKP